MKLLKGNNILSRVQCDVLRGIAITGIFLHNFCHWLKGANEENEYLFNQERADNMWNYWTSGNIDQFFPIQFFSFFGHYGVPLFLFLSGFGLVMKYEKASGGHLKALSFVGYHWLKLFRLMILGYLLSILVYALCGFGFHPWNEILAQLAMVVNAVFINSGSALSPGPYWFFGLMFEVYILYVLLLYPTRDKGYWRWLVPVLLIVLAFSLQLPLQQHSTVLNYFRYNVVVALMPLSVGIMLARYGLPQVPRWCWALIAFLGLGLLAVFSMDYVLWLWSPLVVIVGAVAFVKSLPSGAAVFKPMAWMGMMSSFIFVVHSIPRIPMFKFWLWKQPALMTSHYLWLLAYIVLTLLLAWLYKKYLTLIPSPRLHNDGSISFSRK